MTFRQWCREKWYEHCDEIEAWTGQRVLYLSDSYFNKYKWWLRREYRAEMRKNSEPYNPFNTVNS